jgi:hypothetical protein
LFEWTLPTAIATTDAAFDQRQVAIATDDRGRPHVVLGSRDGIVYLTQRHGEWRRSLLTTPRRGGYDGSPAIAVDANGRLAVVYQRWARWECQMGGCAPNDSMGVAFIQSDGDGWGEPEVVGEPSAREPDIEFGDDVIYLTYVDDERLWIEYQTIDETGSVGIAPPDAQWPSLAQLPTPYCSPAVLFTRHETPSSRLVVAIQGEDERLQLVDGPALDIYHVPSAIGLAGPFCMPVVAAGNELWAVTQTGWSEIRTVFPRTSGLSVGDMAVDGEAPYNLVSSVAQPSESLAGLWFATGYDDGPMTLEEITSDRGQCCSNGYAQAIAVDDAGQPHVVWTTTSDEDVTVWYATGRRP